MSILNIQLFGQLEMKLGDDYLRPFPTKKSKSLFAFLVTNQGRAFPREVLASMFWGDQPERSARKCLRTAIWRVRSTVEPAGVPPGKYVIDRDHALVFGLASDIRVDVEEFERRITSNSDSGDPGSPFVHRTLQDAVRLYRGEFLEGIYDDWALCERDRLKSLLLKTFERLVDLCEKRRDWPGAIMWSQRLLASDAMQENVYRDLMRFFALCGNRPAAIRCFESLCRMLSSELGVSPMRETLELYEAIRSERTPTIGLGNETTASRSESRLKFTTPTVCPLVMMHEQPSQMPGLIPSPVYGNRPPPPPSY